MSALSTPARHNHGLMVDTKPSHTNVNVVFSNGYHTPPNSAIRDSRRNSVESSVEYSQPTTPARPILRTESSFLNIADIVDAKMPREMSLHGAYLSSDGSDFSSYPMLRRHSESETPTFHGIPPYAYEGHISPDEKYAFQPSIPSPAEAWSVAQQLSSTPPAYFGAALFPPSPSFDTRINASGPPLNSSITLPIQSVNMGFEQYSAVATSPAYNPLSAVSNLPQAQVVIPSQVSLPDNYLMHRFDDYSGTEPSNNSLAQSFSSSGSLSDSYDYLDDPSPMDAYLDQTDEDDYSMVRDPPSIPDDNFDSHRSCLASKPRRKKSTKPSRHERRQPWHTVQSGEIELQCIGTKFEIGGPLPILQSQKEHVCGFIEKDGTLCTREFDRAEHLKRHKLYHSDERPYPCPVPDCPKNPDTIKPDSNKIAKGISRSDNATDHFKTHLRYVDESA